ncbi:hypothetical protein KFE94_13825 [bacterium SCSIO 12643]|nr:hypothetical protein KFE94_13825 [bacterium SCSIO 12643]
MRTYISLTFFLVFVSLGVHSSLSAQSIADQSTRIDPLWVIDFQSGGFIPEDIVTDNSGNIYTTGSFNMGIVLADSIHIWSTGGRYDGIANTYFLMKHDSSGKLLWISYGMGKCRSRGVEIDSEGNIYTVGESFSPVLNFISSRQETIYVDKPADPASHGLFICKHDSLGNILATRFISNNEREAPQDFKIDHNDQLIIVGNSFYTVENESKRKYFILKLDSDFQPIWQKNGENNGRSHVIALTTDKKGNIYTTGGFFERIKIDDQVLISKSHAQTFFVSKFDPNGKLKWINSRLNLPKSQFYPGVGQAVALQKNKILISGSIHSNLFISQLNTRGKVKWLLQTNNGVSTSTSNILINDRDFFIVGKTTRLTFPSTDTNNISIQSKGATDFHIAKYNLKGQLISLHSGGGLMTDYGDAACIHDQNIFLLGHILGGKTQFQSKSIHKREYTMWIAKFPL